MSTGGLLLAGVHKTYPGQVQAVVDLSLAVAPGELVVLFGPSGCGKTTTLRMIAGLERVSSGEIVIGGRNVTRLAPHQRGVAMVFQDYVLYPHLSVEENLRFGWSDRFDRQRAGEEPLMRFARALQIDRMLSRRPEGLSGGQRQRAALARAVVRRRPVTLLDEPLSNVDGQLRLEIRREIKELTRETGTSMVYVTHDQAEALALADRLAVMRQGELVQIGAAADVYARPANRYVAEILTASPLTLLAGRVGKAGRGYVLEMTDRLMVLGDAPLGQYLGRDVLVGIRPDAVAEDLPQADGGTGGPALFGRVNAIEHQGDSILVFVGIEREDGAIATTSLAPGETQRAGARLAARFDARRGVRLGERLRLRLDVSRLLWFDAEGNRIESVTESAAEARLG